MDVLDGLKGQAQARFNFEFFSPQCLEFRTAPRTVGKALYIVSVVLPGLECIFHTSPTHVCVFSIW